MPSGVYERTEFHKEILRRNVERARSGIDYSAPRKPLTSAHKARLSSVRKGLVFSLEHRLAISRALTKRFEDPEERRKLSEMWKGDKSPFWRGGVSTQTKTDKSSFEYNQWRLAVLKRDNYTCVWCGDRNHKGRGSRIVLNVDHIKPYALFPELRFDVDNGRVLCIDCHRKTDTYGFKTAKLLRDSIKPTTMIDENPEVEVSVPAEEDEVVSAEIAGEPVEAE